MGSDARVSVDTIARAIARTDQCCRYDVVDVTTTVVDLLRAHGVTVLGDIDPDARRSRDDEDEDKGGSDGRP
ncbi:hypothetical protein J4H86_21290 [Spiractinospora alimapuensis]|uniref:hypothetical protein n=1 Tax=Spiractinospora alimapuensis TaxID=2820884 RepID=UPI001F23523C|nr:hypothetical protein [Spiractinospora alimapuensis]QVQ51326.1 hypothetical protein J4H86_21290 [Spiractinospora alimapuensis]